MDSDTPASSVLPRCPQNTVLTKLIMKVMVCEITWKKTNGRFTFMHLSVTKPPDNLENTRSLRLHVPPPRT